MKILVLSLAVLMMGGVAFAGTDNEADVPLGIRDACTMQAVTYNWDFNISNQGFTPVLCGGGLAVWAWGLESVIPGSPGNVWGTVLNGNYPNNAGHGLLSPAFQVTPSSYLLEVNHYVRTETNWDGCNVTVNGTVITPTNNYPATLYTAPLCVSGELGWTGNGSTGASQVWIPQCFDLTAYMNQTIQVEFDFGSDSSVTYPGWYLAYVKVGGAGQTPAEKTTWGRIKSIHR